MLWADAIFKTDDEITNGWSFSYNMGPITNNKNT